MSDSAAEAAETSKAGALRMRRLARLTPLIPPATSAVHRPSGQIIYRALPPSLTPTHFISSFTPHAQPRPLALPPYLGPGKELSISPSGEWVVIFHPAPSTINQTSEGGTLAIYSSAILSPLALPGNVVPLATFPLPSDVLAIQHIYGMSPGRGDGEDGAMAGSTENEQQSDTEPPKPEQEGGNLAGVSGSAGSKRISPPTYGPHPPSTYSPTQGPAFLVLTSTGIILFHPQVLPPPPGTLSAGVEYEPQYAYNTLKCPLHTRWYATSGGMAPPDIGRVDRGWAGIVRGDEGVWFAYEDTEVFGLLRAEVVIKDGKASLLTTRMPPLPVPSQSIRRVQGVMFASVPKHALPAESRPSMRRDGSGGGEDVDMEAGAEAGDAGDRDKVDRVGEKDGALVGVVVASRTTTPATETTPVHVQTHVATYAVQRCEVDIVDAFREINGSVGEKNEAPAAWDWYALPSALSDNPLPPNTLILALAPLYPLLHPRAVALLANPPDAAPTLVHLDLCPPPSSAGTAVDTTDATSGIVIAIGDKGTPIDPELILGISAPCMLSPAAEEGYVGQVGVLDPRKGPVFYAMPAIAGGARTRGMGDGEGGDGEVAGLRGEERLTIVQAIITAALRGEGYADVLGALFVQTPKNRLSDMLLRTLTDCYTAFRRHPRVEENVELARLQVALFSQSADPRQGLAATVCRLLAAVVLFDRCAVETEQGIDFELVAEYIISTLASTLRTAVLYQGRTAWSSQQSSQQSSQVQPIPADLILILHPTFRSLLLRLLAQIRTFKSFVQSLEKPILQPESRYAPAPSVRDPRATIVARERVGDIGMKDGVDIMLWGRGLVLADKRVREIEEGETEEARLARREKEDMAIFELNPDLLGDGAKGVLNGLPCPSEILLAPSGTEEGHAGVDGITFLPLGDMADLDDTPTHSQQNINGHSVNGSTVANPGANPRERRVRCNTCGSRTEALGWTRGQGMNMGVFGTRYASGLGSSVGWNGWRAAREKGCVCGGAWTR